MENHEVRGNLGELACTTIVEGFDLAQLNYREEI